MSAPIHFVIAERRFALTESEALFLSKHLETAARQPNRAISFKHASGGENGVISLERASADRARAPNASVTDC